MNRYEYIRYKPHFICLDCRVGFKQRMGPVVKEAKPACQKCGVEMHRLQHAQYSCPKCHSAQNEAASRNPKAFVCPHCRKPMEQVGYDFKVPPKNDKKGWAKVRLFMTSGYERYCAGLAFDQLSKAAARAITNRLRAIPHTEGERLARQFKKKNKI